MSLVLQSSGGGSVTLQEPVTASNLTITVPAVTGTMITTASTFAGTGPAFSATMSANQSISSGTATKVILPTEDFDTASCFDNTTNYRFTPNVAGYYQINGIIYIFATTTSSCFAMIYKNGSVYQAGGFQSLSASASTNSGSQVSSIVYFNGTTDYVELYAYAITTGAANLTNAGILGLKCQFTGSLVRAA